MNLRVLLLVSVIVIVCAGPLFGVKLAESRQESELSKWFEDTYGIACTQPCLFGITPGVTRYDDALKMISQHSETRSMQKGAANSFGSVFGDERFSIMLTQTQNGYVGDITITNNVDYFTPIVAPDYFKLGQLIAAVGSPSHITLGDYGSSPDYYFFFEGRLVAQVWNADISCKIDPQVAYQTLELQNYDSRGSDALPWKGFARRDKYKYRQPDELSNCLR